MYGKGFHFTFPVAYRTDGLQGDVITRLPVTAPLLNISEPHTPTNKKELVVDNVGIEPTALRTYLKYVRSLQPPTVVIAQLTA